MTPTTPKAPHRADKGKARKEVRKASPTLAGSWTFTNNGTRYPMGFTVVAARAVLAKLSNG